MILQFKSIEKYLKFKHNLNIRTDLFHSCIESDKNRLLGTELTSIKIDKMILQFRSIKKYLKFKHILNIKSDLFYSCIESDKTR